MQITTSNLPRSVTSAKSNAPLGITSLCLTRSSDEFLVGTETGYVLLCSLDNFSACDIKVQQEVFNNCVIRTYEPHIGAVLSVACSPFSDQFLTCSTDGAVRLYDSKKEKCALTWEPCTFGIHSVAWSTHKKELFACIGANNVTYVYDLEVFKSNIEK
jgi:WD40 repeat protein